MYDISRLRVEIMCSRIAACAFQPLHQHILS